MTHKQRIECLEKHYLLRRIDDILETLPEDVLVQLYQELDASLPSSTPRGDGKGFDLNAPLWTLREAVRGLEEIQDSI